MGWIDDAAKMITQAAEIAARDAKAASKGKAKIKPATPVLRNDMLLPRNMSLADLKRPPKTHNGGPAFEEPFTLSGQAVRDRLVGIPTAREIAGRDAVPIGSGYTVVKSRQSAALPESGSSGYTTGLLSDPVQLDIADAQGRTLLGIVGDNSGRKIVTNVMSGGRDVKLREPVNTEGGFQYMDEGSQGYAGALGPTRSKANEASMTENPLYTSILMAEKSPDFARPTSNIFGQLFEQAPILQKDIDAINEQIRSTGVTVKGKKDKNGVRLEPDRTVYPFQDFESVKDPAYLGQYIQNLPSGTMRADFLKGLDRAGLQKLGVPNVSDARLAMADENQIGMDWGTAGYRAMVPDLERGVYKTAPNQSTTYEAGIDKIGPAYSFTGEGRGIPAGLLFPDLAAEMRLKGTGGKLEMTSPKYKVMEGSPTRAKSLVDQSVVDVVSAFRELEKTEGRGPAMQFANSILSGGRVTSEMVKEAQRLNAPKWIIAAMVAAMGGEGLLSDQTGGGQF